MLKNIHFQRLLVIFNALAIGFVIERWTDLLYLGLLAVLIVSGAGLFLLSNKVLKATGENLGASLDPDITSILRSTVLAVSFFIECALAAWLILAQGS